MTPCLSTQGPVERHLSRMAIKRRNFLHRLFYIIVTMKIGQYTVHHSFALSAYVWFVLPKYVMAFILHFLYWQFFITCTSFILFITEWKLKIRRYSYIYRNNFNLLLPKHAHQRTWAFLLMKFSDYVQRFSIIFF